MTYQEKVRAKELLKNLLPEARAKMKSTIRVETRTAMGKTQEPYLIEPNLAGVHIFHANLGGWIADIYFDNMPLGIANCIGTPVRSPHKTYAEARAMAIEMLTLVLVNTEKNLPPSSKATFQLYDMVFSVPLDDLQTLGTMQVEFEGDLGYGSQDHAVRRLEEMLKLQFGDREPSHETFNKLDIIMQTHLYAICAMCLLSGVMRYPPREPAILEE
jgi:hypothetical protein